MILIIIIIIMIKLLINKNNYKKNITINKFLINNNLR